MNEQSMPTTITATRKIDAKGRFEKGHIPWIKGRGMTPEQIAVKRKASLIQYNNKPERKAIMREYARKHRLAIAEAKKKYAKSERGAIVRKRIGQTRIAREKKLQKSIDWEYWYWMIEKLGYKCQMCGKSLEPKLLALDHIVPISLGGDNDSWNIQPLCKSCNSRKSNRAIGMDSMEMDLVYGDWLLMKQGVYV